MIMVIFFSITPLGVLYLDNITPIMGIFYESS